MGNILRKQGHNVGGGYIPVATENKIGGVKLGDEDNASDSDGVRPVFAIC